MDPPYTSYARLNCPCTSKMIDHSSSSQKHSSDLFTTHLTHSISYSRPPSHKMSRAIGLWLPWEQSSFLPQFVLLLRLFTCWSRNFYSQTTLHFALAINLILSKLMGSFCHFLLLLCYKTLLITLFPPET